MQIQEDINRYIDSQSEAKQVDMRAIHGMILEEKPDCRLWFTDGKNSDGKQIANPNIGYDAYTIKYADGSTKEFFRVGLSANTAGFSVYIMGIGDKTYLARTFSGSLGKASVTGYCIKFRKLSDIDLDTLRAAIQYGFSISD